MNYNNFVGYLLLFIFNSFLITIIFSRIIRIFSNLDK